jgi:hypothetical protein
VKNVDNLKNVVSQSFKHFILKLKFKKNFPIRWCGPSVIRRCDSRGRLEKQHGRSIAGTTVANGAANGAAKKKATNAGTQQPSHRSQRPSLSHNSHIGSGGLNAASQNAGSQNAADKDCDTYKGINKGMNNAADKDVYKGINKGMNNGLKPGERCSTTCLNRNQLLEHVNRCVGLRPNWCDAKDEEGVVCKGLY